MVLNCSRLIFGIFVFSLAMMPSCSKPTETSLPAPQENFAVQKNVEWARPNGQSLTMDIYIPKTGKAIYPVLVVFHGGGWLINDNSIMSQSAQYIAQHSDYIVCNVNYRLLGDNGNTVTMNQIIEDVFGAVLWIKDNIHSYGGDSSKVAITGDSSGGHLAAMILCCGDKLESDGFAGSSFGYCPTYLPAGMTAEEVARRNGLTVQAAILSYGAFDIYTSCLNGLESGGNIFWALAQKNPRGIFGDSINVTANGEWYRAVSPVYNIPQASARSLPPTLCTVGSRDNLVSPASVKDFVSLLKEAGQPAEYWEYAGEPHGFLSSGANPLLGISFEKDAPPALDRMIQFLDSTIRR